MPEAYPLAWPLAVPRTPADKRRRALFGKRNDRVPPDSVVISTNVRTRLDGLPYSNAAEPDDPGVCVYFELDGFPVALPCDTFDRVADNLAAVAGHLDADRRQERYGVGRAADRFAGFQALPAPGQTSGEAWWEVLGLTPDASAEDVRRAYRQAAHDAHPDGGGSRDAWDRLVEAYRMGLAVTNRS